MAAGKVLRAACIAVALAASGVQAAEVAGVRIDDKVTVDGKELALNGAGLRTKFFVKVYVGALYAGQKSASPQEIYDSPAPRRMVMRMLRDMEAAALHAALEDGLRNNLTSAELAELKLQSDQLGAIMKGIGAVKEGDVIAIDFTSAGVEVGLNGMARGKIAGIAFAKALLRVWLGDAPADGSLKKALLGG